jgi:hypothetical protein
MDAFRTGASVQFTRVDTGLCSKWTANWTALSVEVVSEVDNTHVEVDRSLSAEVDSLMAHPLGETRQGF